MEYERTEDGQIQASFAYRVGQILLQYDKFIANLPIGQQFEATLAVSLLQSVASSCQQLIRAKGSTTLKTLASRGLLDDPSQLGLNPDCVLRSWPSTRGLTYREVIDCIRNALCHPGSQRASAFPRTGFTTEASNCTSVTAYVFTESSWVNSSGRGLKESYAPCRTDSKAKLERAMGEWASNRSVDGLRVGENDKGLWQVLRGNEPFVPVLQLRLGVQQLRTLTLNLCDHLSEPLRELSGIAA